LTAASTEHQPLVLYVEIQGLLALLSLERLLNEYDVELHTIEGSIDTSTPDGFMGFPVKSFTGETEGRQAKYRTKKAMAQKKPRNQVVGHVPFRYSKNKDYPVPDLREQQVTKRANELHAERRGLAQIAKTLNESGLATRTGRRWDTTGVRRMLTHYQIRFKEQKTRIGRAARQFIEAIA
jgi:DNA invertase Pin-like site-specific DNA recombinase